MEAECYSEPLTKYSRLGSQCHILGCSSPQEEEYTFRFHVRRIRYLGCNTVQFEDSQTFRKNVWPINSMSTTSLRLMLESGSLFTGLLIDPEDGGNMFLRNIVQSPD